MTRDPNPVTQTQWRGRRGEHALAESQVVGTTKLRLEEEKSPTSTFSAYAKVIHTEVGNQKDDKKRENFERGLGRAED